MCRPFSIEQVLSEYMYSTEDGFFMNLLKRNLGYFEEGGNFIEMVSTHEGREMMSFTPFKPVQLNMN